MTKGVILTCKSAGDKLHDPQHAQNLLQWQAQAKANGEHWEEWTIKQGEPWTFDGNELTKRRYSKAVEKPAEPETDN